jgi:iron complex outermembrane receptor protein
MKRYIGILLFISSVPAMAQNHLPDTLPVYRQFDTVTITSALGRALYRNIPYSINSVNLLSLRKTPRPQLMNQLAQLPSVSSISSGDNINKPVIRGLSFNHIQLFAQGTRIDNQTWDDRHDIGIADNGFDKVEVVNGPAALIYGPNTMGGAIVLQETAPQKGEKKSAYVQLGFFGNSVGANLNAGFRGTKNDWYYSAHVEYEMHANYVQGKEEEDTSGEDKPIAGNSKFTNLAFKGMIGVRKEKSEHRLTYNLYKQLLGIVEDEGAANPGAPEEERDYEMEAPYQDVMTHVISSENSYRSGKCEFIANAGYQFNTRKEFEPGNLPKSKYLGVGLDLQTITGDFQWLSDKNKPAGIAVGIQGFYQNNTNKGNWVLVPDAHIATYGTYFLAHYNSGQWNLLGGVRIDQHRLNMFTTIAAMPDTFNPAVPKPTQALQRNYTPFSFNAIAVWHANDQFSIKLNGASGYAAPNYAQLTAFGKHEGSYRFEVGNNFLQMEKNNELDIALQWQNQNAGFSLNGYINSINNYIYITPTADSIKGLRIYDWVQKDAVISGLELSLDVHPANAKWFEGSLKAGLTSGKLTGGKGDLPYIPASKVITGLTFKKEMIGQWQQSYLTLQASFYGEQKKVAQFEEPTEGYFLADLFIGTNVPLGRQHRWNLVAFCTNLFNKGYFNHLSLIKTIDVREPGRNVGVQVRYSIN